MEVEKLGSWEVEKETKNAAGRQDLAWTNRNQKNYFSHRGHGGHRGNKMFFSVISVTSVAKNFF
jgi:hypothetical protein